MKALVLIQNENILKNDDSHGLALALIEYIFYLALISWTVILVLCFSSEVMQARGQMTKGERTPHQQEIYFFSKVWKKKHTSHLLQDHMSLTASKIKQLTNFHSSVSYIFSHYHTAV